MPIADVLKYCKTMPFKVKITKQHKNRNNKSKIKKFLKNLAAEQPRESAEEVQGRSHHSVANGGIGGDPRHHPSFWLAKLPGVDVKTFYRVIYECL